MKVAMDTKGKQDPAPGEGQLFARFRHKKLGLPGGQARIPQLPQVPRSIAELGVGVAVLNQLILKHLLLGGVLRNDELAKRMAVPMSLLEDPTQFLRTEAMIESHSRGASAVSDVRYLSLTERGRDRAHVHMEESSYCGAVPVPLQAYTAQVHEQTVRDQVADRAQVGEVYRNIVVDERLLNQIGAAFNSGSSIFFYGPPGTGKTFLAGQMVKLLHGDIAVPYAVEVEGQIIRVFDPVTHEPTAIPDARLGQALDTGGPEFDPRWAVCKRPVIVSGGELTPEMLDLQYQAMTGFYEAPLQMKANGGIFLIDDLGRQLVRPEVLLNRWIVPLENEVDYLSLHTGAKFQIPFDIMPMFATNLDPEEIADEAFLRRLGHKIHVTYLSERDYHKIFQQYCAADDIPYDAETVDQLIADFYVPSKRPLAACHPRDLINKVIDFSLYEGVEPRLTRESLARAWDAYFVSR